MLSGEVGRHDLVAGRGSYRRRASAPTAAEDAARCAAEQGSSVGTGRDTSTVNRLDIVINRSSGRRSRPNLLTLVPPLSLALSLALSLSLARSLSLSQNRRRKQSSGKDNGAHGK